ncbi:MULTISPECIES: N-acetylneuraminate synthase family protein [unclassified Methylophilus]|uniref:N-acetylneuraminate synthase family protein n=1 Tax=unclassified Methylophilus TaxID=2630143 RepID=UPI0006F37F31|nr:MULTISPECIES: N-acetylneuraminate synthase family protein [unclassified Methylophilus]KQT37221.1 polyhydroxyalkanoate biosynthesis repressor PhaR [Methylophilus sp. Leaf416]KQT55609.1 polyhydroxyalkanoate biosynthesis repressor PhaR [Methylophilus sp. Leaf459]
MAEFSIAGRLIGDNHPPLVIAEIGINHEGSIDVAIEMADAAINSGAEIIKHQTHIIEDEMSNEAKEVVPGNADVSIYEIMNRCALNEADEKKLMDYVKSRNVIFISTPFSRAAVDRLVSFDIPAFKIGSGECNNYPLIRYISQFKKPVILSTGMNTIESIRKSVNILKEKNIPFALLHCTNIYPTPPELVRLGGITQLKEEFPDAVVGLSDHTTSNYTCLGAVALGASILERHFTDSMSRPGPDIVCSMDRNTLSQLIDGSKIIFQARGGKREPIKEEAATISFAFASVVSIADINAGETLSDKNIWVKRPSGGDFTADDYESLLGKSTVRAIKKGQQIKKTDILGSTEHGA